MRTVSVHYMYTVAIGFGVRILVGIPSPCPAISNKSLFYFLRRIFSQMLIDKIQFLVFVLTIVHGFQSHVIRI